MNDRALEELHESAWCAYKSGQLRPALRLVQQCLSRDSDDGRAWELCGLIHYASANYRLAVACLERASVCLPLRAPGRVCLGHAYAKTGRLELARDLLRLFIDDGSMTVSLLLQIAAALRSLNRPDLAVLACRRAIRRDDQVAQAHYDLALSTGLCGYPPGVVEALARKAIDLAADVVQFRVGLVGFLVRKNQRQQAHSLVADLSSTQLASLGCERCLSRLSDLYRDAGDWCRVVICQQRRLELASRSVDADCCGGTNLMTS